MKKLFYRTALFYSFSMLISTSVMAKNGDATIEPGPPMATSANSTKNIRMCLKPASTYLAIAEKDIADTNLSGTNWGLVHTQRAYVALQLFQVCSQIEKENEYYSGSKPLPFYQK